MERVMVTRIRYEFLVGLACVLMLVGSFAPWNSKPALGTWNGAAAFAGGLVLLFATLVGYELLGIEQLEKRKVLTCVLPGALGGVLGLIGALTYSPDPTSRSWGLYLTIIAGLIALFAACMLYRQERPRIPRGLAPLRVSVE